MKKANFMETNNVIYVSRWCPRDNPLSSSVSGTNEDLRRFQPGL